MPPVGGLTLPTGKLFQSSSVSQEFAMISRRTFTLGLSTVATIALALGNVSAFAQTAPAAKPAPPAKTAPAANADAQPISATELADRVQSFYDKSKTFRAKFKQRYFVAAYRKTKDSHGDVVFQKPGKMSWRYANNGNRVVSDGKEIKVYENANKQMYVQDIDKSQYPAALSFLLGDAKLKQEFHLKKLDADKLQYEGGYVLLAVPKSPTPAYQQLLLYVDGGTYQVRRVLMIDAQRNRNRFDFESPVVNQPVDPAEFTFTPPPGTNTIKP
jgi:outer membrane lipoprotein carrier protein